MYKIYLFCFLIYVVWVAILKIPDLKGPYLSIQNLPAFMMFFWHVQCALRSANQQGSGISLISTVAISSTVSGGC